MREAQDRVILFDAIEPEHFELFREFVRNPNNIDVGDADTWLVLKNYTDYFQSDENLVATLPIILNLKTSLMRLSFAERMSFLP